DTWPQSNHITWIFPGNELTEESELQVEWFDGEFYPPEEVRAMYSVEDYPAESAMVIGTEGALLIPHTQMPVLLPEERFEEVRLRGSEPRNHYHHFVVACSGGEETACHFAQAGPLTEVIILATVALREPDKTLKWVPVHMAFPNHSEAEKYLSSNYGSG